MKDCRNDTEEEKSLKTMALLYLININYGSNLWRYRHLLFIFYFFFMKILRNKIPYFLISDYIGSRNDAKIDSLFTPT